MKKTKKRMVSLASLFALAIPSSLTAMAEEGGGVDNAITKLSNTATSLLSQIMVVGWVAAAISIAVAGFMFMTCDDEGRQKAKKRLIWTIIGAILVAGAITIAKFVSDNAGF